jgi:aldehyde dehydrogenase
MHYGAQNTILSTTELGGKSPHIFFADVMAQDDSFLDKAIEGLVLYAFNKGEACTCPSRALIHESIYDEFMERCLLRIGEIRQGDPLDAATMLGAQVSTAQLEKVERYCPDRARGGRRAADRRRAVRARWRAGPRLLLPADRL